MVIDIFFASSLFFGSKIIQIPSYFSLKVCVLHWGQIFFRVIRWHVLHARSLSLAIFYLTFYLYIMPYSYFSLFSLLCQFLLLRFDKLRLIPAEYSRSFLKRVVALSNRFYRIVHFPQTQQSHVI